MADRKLVIEAEFRAGGLQSGLANATKQVQDFTRSLNTPANIAFNVDAKNLGKVRDQIAALGQNNAVNVALNISGNDLQGAKLAEIKRNLDELQKPGNVAVKVNIDTAQSVGAFERIKQAGLAAAKDIQRGFLENVGRGISNAISGAVGGAASGVGNFLGDSVQKFQDFSGVINEFSAKVGGTPAQIKALSDEAKRLGAETSTTPKQAAEATVEFGKLGFTADEVTKQLSGIVKLSEAAGGSPALAAELGGRAYKLFGEQVKSAGDIIATVANTSSADIADFQQAFSDAGGVAAANNQSFKDFAATFGLLRDAGRTAGTAGNDIKILLSRLGAPSTAEAKKSIEQLGISVRDTAGNFRPLAQIIPEIRTALSRFDPGEQARLSKVIFGDEGAPAFLGLMKLSEDAVTKAFSAVNSAGGATAATSEKLLAGFPGALEQLGGSIETIQTSLGEAIAPALEGAARGATVALNAIGTSPVFGQLKTQFESVGKSFQEALSSKEFQAAAVQIASSLGGAAVDAAKNLAGFLKENPQAISEAAQAATTLISALGEAGKVAGDILGKIAAGIQEINILRAGGGEKVGQQNALKAFGATDKDLAELDKRVNARLPETANPFSGVSEEKIRQQEGDKLAQELIKRAEAEKQKTAITQQGEQQRTAATQQGAQQRTSAELQAGQQKAAANASANAQIQSQDQAALQQRLAAIDAEKTARARAIEENAAQQANAQLGQQSLAIADTSGSQKSAELQAQLELGRAIAEQNEARISSEIAAAQAAGDYRGVLEGTNELFDARKAALDEQQALEDQINQVTNEQNLNKAKAAELQAQLNALVAEAALLEGQAAGKGAAQISNLQKQVELAKKASQVASEGVKSQQRVNDTQDKTREVRQKTAQEKLGRDRESAVRGVKEEQQKRRQSERKKQEEVRETKIDNRSGASDDTADEELAAIDRKTKLKDASIHVRRALGLENYSKGGSQEVIRDKKTKKTLNPNMTVGEVEALKREKKGGTEEAQQDALNEINNVSEAAEQAENKRIDLIKKRIESEGEYGKTVREALTARAEIGAGRANETVQLVAQLKDVGIPDNVKQTIKNQLAQLGFTPSGNAEEDIARAARIKFQQEEELAKAKREALLFEQSIARGLLEIDIERERVAAKGAQTRAQATLAEAALAKDDTAIAAANAAFESANEQSNSLDRSANKRRQILDLTQQTALAKFDAEDQARRRAAELELAKSDKSFVGGRAANAIAPFNSSVPGGAIQMPQLMTLNSTLGGGLNTVAGKLDALINATKEGTTLNVNVGAGLSPGQVEAGVANANARRLGL